MSSSKLKPRRVLLVDDDVELRAILGGTLARAGYEIGHANNGMQALAMHHQNPFDVFIIEIVLPGKDGFEMLAELTAHASPPRLIAMSRQRRFASRLYLNMAKHLGAHQLLAKPFPPGTVAECGGIGVGDARPLTAVSLAQSAH